MRRFSVLFAAAALLFVATECQAGRYKPVHAAAAKAACLTGKVAKAALKAPCAALRVLAPCRSLPGATVLRLFQPGLAPGLATCNHHNDDGNCSFLRTGRTFYITPLQPFLTAAGSGKFSAAGAALKLGFPDYGEANP